MGDVSTNVSVTGSQQYKAELGSMKAKAKELDSEMKALTSGFDKNADSSEQMAAKQSVLAKQIENQEEIVSKLSGRYAELQAETERMAAAAQQAAEEHGADSKEAQKAAIEYERFRTATANVGTELNNAQAQLNQMRSGFEDAGNAAQDSGEKVLSFGDILEANLLAEGIKSGLTAILDIIKNIATGFYDLGRESAAYGDELATLQTKTGMTTDALQEYDYMAQLTDVSLEKITSSHIKLSKAISSAASGEGKQAELFKQLGIEIANADGSLRTSSEVFPEVIAALGEIGNETELDAAAMDLFGKSAVDLKPLIEMGTDALEDLRQEAHDVGYVLSEEQVGALHEADDAWQRLTKNWEGIKHQLGAELAPAFEDAFKKISESLSQVDWDKVAADVGVMVDEFVKWVQDFDAGAAIEQINELIPSVKEIANALAALGDACKTVKGFWDALFNDDGAKDLDMDARAESWKAANAAIEKNQQIMNNQSVPYLERMNDASATIGPLSAQLDAMAKIMTDKAGPASEEMADDFTEAAETVEALGDDAKQWGQDFVQEFIDGVNIKKPALDNTITEVANSVRSKMHFSLPDEGPLADADKWMPDMMELLASGIRANIPVVEAATNSAAEAMAAGLNLNRQAMEAQQQGVDVSPIAAALREQGGSVAVTVVLEGDAEGLFRVVRTENNRQFAATGYNRLGRR